MALFLPIPPITKDPTGNFARLRAGRGLRLYGSTSGYSEFAPGSTGDLTISMGSRSGGDGRIDSTGHATKGVLHFNGTSGARVTAAGVFSCPGAGNNSERFGSGATAAGTESLALGYQATASVADGIAIGHGAAASGAANAMAVGDGAAASAENAYALGSACLASATNALAIGRSATAAAAGAMSFGANANSGGDGSGIDAIAIGRIAVASANTAISIGYAPTASAAWAIAIGNQTNAGHQGSIALGVLTATTATNQLVAGSGTWAISDVYFGKGVTNSTATAWTLHGTGGSGANNAGGNLVIAPGQSTGNATPASVILQSTVAGASGSTAQTLFNALTLSGLTLTFYDALNMAFDTTTGTKIGTATTQKIGFWNATPVVQQVLATGGGATVDNVISLLQTLGLCRQTA